MEDPPALHMTLGFRVALLIGIAAAGFVFGWVGFGDFPFSLVPARIFGVVTKYQFLAIQAFVHMGVMLEKSRAAEDMLEVIGRLSGRLNGGMAVALIVVGGLMGASTGIGGATVVTLTLLTMPVLLRRGYGAGLSAGAICASGTLGQIIPPSLVLIPLADIMGESVGNLFAAAMLPGLMPAGLYILFILVLGFFLEWIEISDIALPLPLPFFVALGTDMVWLAALIALNLQTSFLTPPFGWALFFLKGAAPPGVTTAMIHRGVLRFIGIQILALVLPFNVPAIATWLPGAIGW